MSVLKQYFRKLDEQADKYRQYMSHEDRHIRDMAIISVAYIEQLRESVIKVIERHGK